MPITASQLQSIEIDPFQVDDLASVIGLMVEHTAETLLASVSLGMERQAKLTQTVCNQMRNQHAENMSQVVQAALDQVLAPVREMCFQHTHPVYFPNGPHRNNMTAFASARYRRVNFVDHLISVSLLSYVYIIRRPD